MPMEPLCEWGMDGVRVISYCDAHYCDAGETVGLLPASEREDRRYHRPANGGAGGGLNQPRDARGTRRRGAGRRHGRGPALRPPPVAQRGAYLAHVPHLGRERGRSHERIQPTRPLQQLLILLTYQRNVQRFTTSQLKLRAVDPKH